jgi:general secretion pathway protein K
VALLIALFAIMLMTFIAVEVSYDTSVDYVVAAQQVARIKAYYAAKSGVEISLLRIMLYKQVMAGIGTSLGNNKSMLDPIWNFPFMWPPTAMGADKVNEVDKDMLKETIHDSLMQGEQYTATISPEGNKIDVNDLGSNIKGMRNAAIAQVLAIFKSEIQHNEEFARKYSSYRFDILVNNIADYSNPDLVSLNGGDKSTMYRDVDEKDLIMPPGRPFRTLDELHQVAGMTDEFYNLIAPRLTTFGTKGVNINYAQEDMLMAIDPSMTKEAVDKIIERRNDIKLGGPFKDENDFYGFLQQYGVNVKNIKDAKIPLIFDMEYNFRISSIGFANNVKREITAVTFDFTNVASRFATQIDQQDQQNQSPAQPGQVPAPINGAAGTGTSTGTGSGANGSSASKFQAPKGRPTVVYWEEN